MKKSLTLATLLAASLLVASCGTKNDASSSAAAVSSAAASSVVASSAEDEVTAVYQISASYDELYDMFAAFEFYGLMYSDNTGILYKGMVQNSGDYKNVAQVEEPISFKFKVTDDDGIETLEAAIGGTKYTGYKNSDGDFVLQGYSFPFAGGYTRSVDLIVSETIEYATVEEWQAGVAAAYADRTITVTVSATFKGSVYYADGDNAGEAYNIDFGSYGTFAAEAKFVFNSDFSVVASWGVGGSNGGASYDGTWTINDEKLHVVTLTIDEEEVTLTGAFNASSVEEIVWNFTDSNSNNLTATLLEVTED